MGRPVTAGMRCKRHPKHRQSVGVCPFCLRERLSRLSNSSSYSSSYGTASSSTSSSSAYSTDSDLSSSLASPPPRAERKRVRLALLLKGHGKVGDGPSANQLTDTLRKSRSFAFVIGGQKDGDKGKRMEEERGREEKEEKKKKGWVWFKLLRGTGRRREEGGALLHSKTTKEKACTKWVL